MERDQPQFSQSARFSWRIIQWFRCVDRIHLCTAWIGILAACAFLVTANGNFDLLTSIGLYMLIIGIFIWSVVSLYFVLTHEDADILLLSDDELPATPEEAATSLTRLEMLNEEGQVMKSWDLWDKVSLVIGQDMGENQVDIDLKDSVYASMIDREHAVLNYANGAWYIEDLGSRNGVSLKKAGYNKEYRLSQTQPCKLDAGDIIFIGLTQLKIY